jgi:hypothetical protein
MILPGPDEPTDIELLREHFRTLWLIVHANGGFRLEKADAEEYPGDDSVFLQTEVDQETGDRIFSAGVIAGSAKRSTP